MPTRHLNNRDTSPRKPALPEITPVNTMLAVLGPRSMAIPKIIIRSVVAGIPSGPAKMRMALHEMINARVK
jgi:hypothetical protein